MAPVRAGKTTIWMCWALVLGCGGIVLCGAAAQGAGGKDWFEVEVTLAKSDFIDGDDGWEVIGEAKDLAAESGAISALDEGSHLWFFSAPLKFLGDVRDSFGCRFSYSLGHYHSDSAGRQPTMVEDVARILKSNPYMVAFNSRYTSSPDFWEFVPGAHIRSAQHDAAALGHRKALDLRVKRRGAARRERALDPRHDR
jgi:hypothetical protein